MSRLDMIASIQKIDPSFKSEGRSDAFLTAFLRGLAPRTDSKLVQRLESSVERIDSDPVEAARLRANARRSNGK